MLKVTALNEKIMLTGWLCSLVDHSFIQKEHCWVCLIVWTFRVPITVASKFLFRFLTCREIESRGKRKLQFLLRRIFIPHVLCLVLPQIHLSVVPSLMGLFYSGQHCDSVALALQLAVTCGADIPCDSGRAISVLSPRGALLSLLLLASSLSRPSSAMPRTASMPPTLQLMPQPGTAWKSVQYPRLWVPSSCGHNQSSSSVCAAHVGYKY